MFRPLIANLSARVLRASVARIANDMALMQSMRATYASVSLLDQVMPDATACSSRDQVMDVAFAATGQASGFLCELGVYKGDSLNKLAKRAFPHKVYGFDTFTGLPEFWRSGFPQGAFDVSGEKLRFATNCVLYKGLFDQTLSNFLKDVPDQARLIHVDCDLYSSTSIALRILTPRITPQTVIVFDEYFNYVGWEKHEHKAFLEFLEATGRSCRYLAYNRRGQQVAVIISDR